MTTKKERFNAVLNYLLSMGVCRSQRKFAESIGYDPGVVSKAHNGDEKYLTDNIFTTIAKVYEPIFNIDWLLNGKGSMLSNPELIKQFPSQKPGKRPYRRHKSIHADSTLSSGADTHSIFNASHTSLESAPHELSDMFQKVSQEAAKISELRKQTETIRAETISLRNDLQAAVSSLTNATSSYNDAKEDFESATKILRQIISKFSIDIETHPNDIGFAAEPFADVDKTYK